jgi:hypothetical protein
MQILELFDSLSKTIKLYAICSTPHLMAFDEVLNDTQIT